MRPRSLVAVLADESRDEITGSAARLGRRNFAILEQEKLEEMKESPEHFFRSMKVQ